VYQLHINGLDPAVAADLVGVCEDLVTEGLIRSYGWSTDSVAGAEVFAAGPHCAVVQHELNLFSDAPAMLDLCERQNLASLNRSPLAMGLLSDRVTADSRYGSDTVRGSDPEWLVWFHDGRPVPEFLARRDAIRDILTSDGRTVAQARWPGSGPAATGPSRCPAAVPSPRSRRTSGRWSTAR
jgi:aryl-alcohol dehydrogenase-like predicted oxidoreductase